LPAFLGSETDMKHPRTNIQHPEKLQAPSSKPSGALCRLDVEVWSFYGAWMLVLGIF
jgi:hypothetical protein